MQVEGRIFFLFAYTLAFLFRLQVRSTQVFFDFRTHFIFCYLLVFYFILLIYIYIFRFLCVLQNTLKFQGAFLLNTYDERKRTHRHSCTDPTEGHTYTFTLTKKDENFTFHLTIFHPQVSMKHHTNTHAHTHTDRHAERRRQNFSFHSHTHIQTQTHFLP